MNSVQTSSPPWRRSTRWALVALLATTNAAAAAGDPASSAGRAPLAATATHVAIAADAPDNAATGGVPFTYLSIAGAVFQGRNGGVGFVSDGSGCLQATAGNARLTAGVQLPEDAVVKYVRIFYYDASAADINVWLTAYDGAGGFHDLVRVQSSGNVGYGTALSTEMNHTVDHFDDALALVAKPATLDEGQLFCGVRIAYHTADQLDTIFTNGFD